MYGMTLPIGVALAFIAVWLDMDRMTLSVVLISAFIVYSWWTTTLDEAEETNVPFVLMIAIGFFCFEWLLCSLDFYSQGCYCSTLGFMFLAHVVIVVIKRN